MLESCHRLGEQFAVGFIANRIDVARLFGAEQIPCTTDFKVAHGDLKASTEVAQFFYRLESPARIFRERLPAGNQQGARARARASPNTPTQLMEVGQAVMVSIIDEDGVGVGDVDGAGGGAGIGAGIGVGAGVALVQAQYFRFE